MKERTLYNYWLLALIAVLCLMATVFSGMAAGLLSAFPAKFWPAMTLRAVQPFHTSLALIWLFFGAQAFTGIFLADERRSSLHLSRFIIAVQLFFLAGVLVTSLRGHFSGREYLTWPALLSWPLALGFTGSLMGVALKFRKLSGHSQEAAWFLLLGFILMPAGLLENQFYLMDRVGLNPGKDLVIQWHSLDTVIAAWSLMLYAAGILILPPQTKPMRSGWLFAIAVIGILFDFGHHNYPSPQAHLIKVIAFSATMLAVVSFVRHVRSFRKNKDLAGYASFLRHIERWTLFAVGTGILMAVPWINYFVHGTYFIVGHTMGSIMGVNTLLLFAGLYHLSGELPGWRKNLLHAFDLALLAFVVVFCALGVAKGVLRPSYDFLVWSAWLKPYMIAIPLAALPLSVILLWFAGDLCRCTWQMLRRQESLIATETVPNQPRMVPAACIQQSRLATDPTSGKRR